VTRYIPEAIEFEIVTKLFSEAHSAGWTTFNSSQKTRQYQVWLADPSIGGRLSTFMSPDEARVWLKDGPMKEYSRSMFGLGKYAALVPSQPVTARDVVKAALGPGWTIVPDSQKIKPLTVRIYEAEEESIYTFAWGPPRDLKHLLWAAVSGQDDPSTWILCITSPPTAATPKNLQLEHVRIGLRCDLRVLHVSI
jgi:hypothetical protein